MRSPGIPRLRFLHDRIQLSTSSGNQIRTSGRRTPSATVPANGKPSLLTQAAMMYAIARNKAAILLSVTCISHCPSNE